MKTFLYIVLGVLVFILVLYFIYFLLLSKLKVINKKIYKYKIEEVSREKNILIICQPSMHKTTLKIADIVKEYVLDKGYGYSFQILSKNNINFNNYNYVFFIAPVYFSSIHDQFITMFSNEKIKNLSIIYNGVNKDSNKEDGQVSKISISKYEKTKIYSDDIEKVKDFLERIIK